MIKLLTDDVCEYVQQNENYIKDVLKEYDIEPSLKNIDIEAQAQINDSIEELKQAAQNFDNVGGFDKIQVCAVLGLWYGKRTGAKTFNTLNECITRFCEDQNTYYFKRKNTALTLAATHHDGVNLFKFYYIKNGKKYAINYDIFMNCY